MIKIPSINFDGIFFMMLIVGAGELSGIVDLVYF